jgi:hypothetical protein
MKNIMGNISTKLFTAALILALAVSVSSCHKEISSTNQIGNSYIVNYTQLFEDYWSAMNKTYVFWSIDKTNWDQVHNTYSPLFAALDANPTNPSNDSLAYAYFKGAADGLIDGSYSLALITGYSIQPALDRKWNNPQFIGNLFTQNGAITQLFPDGVDYFTATIDSGYLSNKVVGADADNQFYAASGYITNTNILYFSFSSLTLLTELSSTDSASTQAQAAILNFFQQLNNPKVSGIIIDFRGNTNGDFADFNYLVGRFITSPTKIGYTETKNGNGRLDYTPWADAIVNPWDSVVTPVKAPIAVLADGLSTGMAELATMSLKTLPHSIFIGDTTWGSNGQLAQNSDYNAGSFNFGNLGTYVTSGGITQYYGFVTTSSCVFKYINNNIYEGKGFPPDYDIKVTPAQLFLGNNTVDDPQLDKAIALLPH